MERSGSASGVAGWDGCTRGRLTTWTTAQGLSADDVISLTATSDGSIWAGTAGQGLNRIHGGVVTVYRREQGLPDDYCLALSAASDGSVLVGTGAGAARVSHAGVHALTPHDTRAASSVGAIVEGHGGEVWMGPRGACGGSSPDG